MTKQIVTKQKRSFLDKIINSDEKGEKQNNENIDVKENNESDTSVLSEIEAIINIIVFKVSFHLETFLE